jgi:glycosyltransferase involved in cell wall biosynthesis
VRVALDGRGIGPGETGVGRSTRLLAEALARTAPPGAGIELFALPEAAAGLPAAPALRVQPCRVPPTAHLLTEIWEATLLRRRLRGLCVELFHAPAFRAPWLGALARVTTVHDAAAFVVPWTIPAKFRLYLRLSVRHALRRSRLVLCPSESVRRELEQLFPAHLARIEVVPWGTPPMPVLEEEEAAARRVRLGLPDRYVLALGGTDRRKNHGTLLDALGLLRSQPGVETPHLVVIGGEVPRAAGSPSDVDRARLAPYIKRIRYLAARDMSAVYRGALALAYPSVYEGFGLPILEAMSLSVPVLTSNRGAMLEVAGDAAMLVDPQSKEQMAEALARLLGDAALRTELIEKGRRRIEQFHWDQTAQRTWSLYEEALSSNLCPGSAR